MKTPMLSLAALAFVGAAPMPLDGTPFPDVKMEVLNSMADGFEDFRGQVVLVEFFGEW